MKCKNMDPCKRGKSTEKARKERNKEKNFFFCRLYLDLTKGPFFF